MRDKFAAIKHLGSSTGSCYQQWGMLALFLIIILGGSYLLGAFVLGTDWNVLRQIRLVHVVGILLLTVSGTLFHTVKAYILLRGAGYRRRLPSIFLVLMTSLSVNYLTPVKAGVPLRFFLYKRYLDVPISTSTAVVTIEAALSMGVPALIALVGIAHLFPFVLSPLYLFGLFLILGLVFLLLGWRPPAIRRMVGWLPGQMGLRRVERFLRNVLAGVRRIPLSHILIASLVSLMNVAAEGMRLYIVMLVLGYDLNPLTLTYVVVISFTTGNLSMLPMGIGVRDASIILLLAQLGVRHEAALSAAVIQRLFVPGWPLLLGLISANILGVREFLSRSWEQPVEEINEGV